MSIINKNVAGIILAAGKGERIGKNKALLKLNGISFLEIVATCLSAADCHPILVIGGADGGAVKNHALSLGLEFVLNENWQKGQFSSLRAGLSELHSNISGAVITLVDHPLVMRQTYQELRNIFHHHTEKVIIPLHNGRKGHPIIISGRIISKVLNSPDNTTLRKVIYAHQEAIYLHEVDDPGILKDIDTIDDLRAVSK
jgi:molybdenum cofactor cytidylyltransferase